jgi:hypothetical protein
MRCYHYWTLYKPDTFPVSFLFKNALQTIPAPLLPMTGYGFARSSSQFSILSLDTNGAPDWQ